MYLNVQATNLKLTRSSILNYYRANLGFKISSYINTSPNSPQSPYFDKILEEKGTLIFSPGFEFFNSTFKLRLTNIYLSQWNIT